MIHYNKSGITIREGDCLELMPELAENSVDAIVTDPPYGLAFMGKAWDHGVPGVPFWEAALRVAKPGAMLLAFGGTRTFHRLAVAIEDAGWEIRDTMMFCYGSGFPKSLDVGKAIDKAAPRTGMFAPFAVHYESQRKAKSLTHAAVCEAGQFYAEHNHGGASVNWSKGHNVPTVAQWRILQPMLSLSDEWLPLIERIEAEREVVGSKQVSRVMDGSDFVGGNVQAGDIDITAPATDAAKQWDGWGTALKPAWEPIIVARKPIQGTVAANVLTWGVGGINVDGCRVGTESRTNGGMSSLGVMHYDNWQPHEVSSTVQGRWPANVILSHSAACVCTGTKRVKGSTGVRGRGSDIYAGGKGFANTLAEVGQEVGYADADGMETVEAWDCSPDCPVRLLDEQSGECPSTKGSGTSKVTTFVAGGPKWTDANTYGDTGGASRFFYTAKADRAERRKSKHPTVKPLDLMRYLVRLVCPIGGVVLDPFMGSGTTIEAARAEHSKAIGFDLSGEYCRDAIARLRQGAFTFE